MSLSRNLSVPLSALGLPPITFALTQPICNRWTRSESGSLIEKECLGQRIDHDEERTLPCYAEELANLLQFKLFTSSTQHMSEICQKYFDLEMLHNKGR